MLQLSIDASYLPFTDDRWWFRQSNITTTTTTTTNITKALNPIVVRLTPLTLIYSS